MGIYLGTPNKEKASESDENKELKVGVSAM
jgi:hypothetical protein